MKIDHDYMKRLLEAFESAPEPIVSIRTLKTAGFDNNDKQFVFHMSLFHDKGLIEREDGKDGFGLMRGADWSGSWSIVPLRLTAKGHDFLEAIRNKEVWATLKKDFKEGSIGTIVDVSKKLFEAYTTNKIETLLKGQGL